MYYLRCTYSTLNTQHTMPQGFLIDQDGVIYIENKIIPGADVFVKTLQDHDIPFTFMTNNSQRTRLDAVRKLAKMGIHVEEKTSIPVRWLRLIL